MKALAIGTWTDKDTIITLLEGDVLASIGEVPAGESSVTTPTTRPRRLPDVTSIGAFAYVSDGLLQRWRPTADTLYVPSSAGDRAGRDRRRGTSKAAPCSRTGASSRWGYNTSGALGLSPYQVAAAPSPLEMSVAKVVFVRDDEQVDLCLATGRQRDVLGRERLRRARSQREIDSDAHPEAEVIQ